MQLNYALDSYELSPKEVMAFPLFSAYAARHYTLGQKTGRCRHYAIAVLEAIPVFGALASLIEYIVVVVNRFFIHRREKQIEKAERAKQSEVFSHYTVKQFIAHQQQINENTLPENYTFKYITNDENQEVGQLQFIFLADIHDDAVVYKHNTRLASHLCKPGHHILTEDHTSSLDVFVDPKVLPETISVSSWADPTIKRILWHGIIRTAGLILDKIIEICKEKPLDNTIITKLIQHACDERQKSGDLIADLRKARSILDDSSNDLTGCLKKACNIGNAVIHNLSNWANTHRNQRQEYLVKKINELSEAIVNGGRNHFVKEEDGQIEPILRKHLASHHITYLITYPVGEPKMPKYTKQTDSKPATILLTSALTSAQVQQKDEQPSQLIYGKPLTFYTFSTLPKRCGLPVLMKLFLVKQQMAAEALGVTLYSN